ncbi:MAG: hypothetical protein A2Y15_04350 [Clostridiales bacterium GWF2_36_10]|nr:MAG: hypothetical protein A2Y15_04350 [Clostridiales bacterium GWF2_36_10]HAN20483.1 hypothetical protein [Clostridiales bacterium]
MILNQYILKSGNNISSYDSIKLYNSAVLPQTRNLRKHCHTSFEISLFKSGKGFYKTRDKFYEINAGDIFFFSTNEEHYITEICEPDEMVIMNIHIDPRFLWKCENIISSKRFMGIFFNRSSNFENRFTKENEVSKHITSLMLETEREFKEKNDSYETMIKLHLFEILTCFIRYFGNSGKESEAKDYRLTYEKFLYINRALDYIDSHFTEPLTLDKLAAISGFSQTHFGTLFKQMIGMSPWDYINLKRVNNARELLKTTKFPIEDISLKSGFNNTTLFNRIFKKIVGLTPSEARKEL